MVSDRICKQFQEERLYEIRFAQKMLQSGKTSYLEKYLGMAGERAKCGMSADEVDAVDARVNKAADETN